MKDKKSTTLEDLAVMVQNGFQHLDEKFTGKFDYLEDKIDKVDERLNGLETKTHETNVRIKSVERDVEYIREVVDEDRYEIEDLGGRVSYIERKLGIVSGKK